MDALLEARNLFLDHQKTAAIINNTAAAIARI
jgi:hypothetical protein